MSDAQERGTLTRMTSAGIALTSDLPCSLLYLLSFLDRVNIGQAAVAGLKQDLGIVPGNAYAIALSVFFIGYVSRIHVW